MPAADRILITEPEHAKGATVFAGAGLPIDAAPAGEEALAAAVRTTGARAVIVGVERYAGGLYRALGEAGAGRGAIIARFGVGHDGVDKALARDHGIVVCNTPGVLDLSVAEHAFWLMGALARRVARLDARTRAGEFAGETGIELHGRRLGILGFGRIGRRVAAMAHAGFGMRVLATDTLPAAELARQEGQSLDELRAAWGLDLYTNDPAEVLRACDILSIHLPAIAATRRYVNAERLALLRPAALLVNTARGSVLDESALYDALAAKRLAGAALDVFEHEPYEPVTPEKDLRSLPNIVLTPHVGSNTLEANRRMAEAALANVSHFFAGRIDRITRIDAA